MKFNSILKEFFLFTLSPKLLQIDKTKISDKILLFIILSFTMLFFVFSSSFLVKIIIYIIDFKEGIKIFNYQNNKLLKYSIWENVFYILLLGPILEEFISRLYLDLKKRSIILTLLCILAITLKMTNLNFDFKFYFLISIIVIFALFTLNIKQDSIIFFGKKYYIFIFYFSCLTFSFLHFSNYTKVLSDNYNWLLPLLVLPQFVMGIFFGYIRIKLGFSWSIFLHICMNIPAVLIYITTRL